VTLDDDLQAYVRRLGVEAEPPSVDALARLHRAQLERIPYETTWIHLDERWTVDLAASVDRVAHRGRGGYCFHVNGAFSELLRALGYDVTLHAGGVYGPDGPTPESIENHLVLLVHGLAAEDCPDGTWYIDAGLGDALHGPLPLATGTYREGPFEFGLRPTAADATVGDWELRHHHLGSFPGMVFERTPTTIDRFAARNVVLSTSPESTFVKTLTVQRRDADGVDIVRGQVLSRVAETATEVCTLETRMEWFDALADVFGLTLDDVDDDARTRLWHRVHTTHEAWLASRR
jgi:N-hydroxyarylamine O-acetyltransferase